MTDSNAAASLWRQWSITARCGSCGTAPLGSMEGWDWKGLGQGIEYFVTERRSRHHFSRVTRFWPFSGEDADRFDDATIRCSKCRVAHRIGAVRLVIAPVRLAIAEGRTELVQSVKVHLHPRSTI